MPGADDYSWFDQEAESGDFVEVFQRMQKENSPSLSIDDSDDSGDEISEVVSSDSSNTSNAIVNDKIFACPEEGCTKTFIRYWALERHCEYGIHKRTLEKMTLQDRAKLTYARYLHEGQTTHLPRMQDLNIVQPSETTRIESGWALKSSSQKSRFNEKQKTFLNKKFMEGEESGNKFTGEEVSKQMRRVRDDHDIRLFTVDEFLTPQQISSYFSRFAAKRRQITTVEYDAVLKDDTLKEATQQIVNTLAADTHPLTFEGTNLCEMERKDVTALRMATVKGICLEHGIQVSGRKKAPYVEAVLELLGSCRCKQ